MDDGLRMKAYRQSISDIEKADNDALFEMSNLVKDDTGLPFVVWISVRGNARHDVCIKVSRGLKTIPAEMISVAIRPEVQVIGGQMKGSDLALLRKWVAINRDVIIRYWDGEASTKQTLAAIRSL